MKKIVLTFGLIAGAILAAMMFITFQFQDQIGFDHAEVIGYTSMVVAFLLTYFGVRSYRDNVAGGTVRFGRAFLVGALISIVASACYVAAWQVIYRKMAPDFVEKYQSHLIEKARAEGATEAAIAQKRVELAKYAQLYRNPVINVAVTFLEPLPVALIVTLVSAGVLSRRRTGAAGGAGVAVRA